MTEILQRIRWANVARAAAVLLALALVIAWPRLRTHDEPLPPAVEPAAAAPAHVARASRAAGSQASAATATTTTAGKIAAGGPVRSPTASRHHRGRHHHARHRAARRTHATFPPPVAPATVYVPLPAPPPGAEFRP
jgi:hypothetical protein